MLHIFHHFALINNTVFLKVILLLLSGETHTLAEPVSKALCTFNSTPSYGQIICTCRPVTLTLTYITVFSTGCHWVVDPEPYYQDCLYDLCSCQMKVPQCLCPIFAAYAKECAHREVMIDWRNDIRECGKLL